MLGARLCRYRRLALLSRSVISHSTSRFFLPSLLLGRILCKDHLPSKAAQLAIEVVLLRCSLALFSHRVYLISAASITSHTCCRYVMEQHPCGSSTAAAVCIRIFRQRCLPASFEDKSAAEAGRGR